MSELRELYQEVILDHGKTPRNFREGDGGRVAHGHNPLCGDKIDVHLTLEGDAVIDVSFRRRGSGQGRTVPWKAGGVLRRPGISGAGQMRHAGLAHIQCGR